MVAKSPSEKIQVVGLGDLFIPAACVVCGNATCQDGYISLGIYVDYVGNLYLCMLCVDQVATTADYTSPLESEMNKTLLREKSELIKELTEEKETLSERLRVFNDALSSISADLPRVLNDAGVVHQSSVEASDSLSEDGESGESTSSEPIKSSGRSEFERVAIRDWSGPIKL